MWNIFHILAILINITLINTKNEYLSAKSEEDKIATYQARDRTEGMVRVLGCTENGPMDGRTDGWTMNYRNRVALKKMLHIPCIGMERGWGVEVLGCSEDNQWLNRPTDGHREI